MDGPEEDCESLEREVHVSGRRGRTGRLWLPPVIAILGAAAPAEVRAQAGRAETREGNRLYEEGRFAEAHEKYLEALLADPDSPIIRFNDGNALYRGEDYESALESFRAAVEGGDPELAAAAWYNLGNTLYRQGALPESLEAFKQALRANPVDADAKHNLERVLQQMQEQQEQQGDGENDEENEDESEQQPQGGEQNQDPQQDQQDQDQPEQDPNQDPQNQPNPEPDPERDPDESESPPQEGTPPPGEMTREEAERLLDAIQEDQDEVNRQPRTPTRGTRPRRDW